MRWIPLTALLAFAGCKSGDNGFVTYDNPPSVTLTDPTEASSFDAGELVQFAALVNDDGSSLTVFWESDLDGALSEEVVTDADSLLFSTASLSVGTHAITVSVVDEAAQSAESSVAISVVEVLEEPVIAVVRPISGETGDEGIPFTAQAQVLDGQDEPIALRVDIDSDVDGSLCIDVVPDLTGVASCAITPTAGTHTLTFTVRDSDGFDATAVALFVVTSSADIDNDGDGFNENQGDCNDADPTVSPNAVEFLNGRDDDCDGIIDNGTDAYDDDGDGFTEQQGDCDDADPLINPNAVEFGDGIDNDCNGLIDDATDTFDDDGDGFSEAAGDCNDTNININPNAADVPYNGVDEDCSGSDLVDVDGDGYDSDLVGGTDCDDSDSAINPGVADNPYNGVDEDCDGGDLRDVDGDGFDYDGLIGGTDCDDSDALINTDAADIPYNGVDEDCSGSDLTDADGDGQDALSAGGQDCDDTDPTIFAGAVEIPYDTIDQDCSGSDLLDVDGDGFDGVSGGGTDCDDTDVDINPGATEIPYNGVDDDCVDGDATDLDGDGYDGLLAGGTDCDDNSPAVNPAAAEIPYNGVDEDCSGADLRDVDGDGFDGMAVGGADCDDNSAAVNPSATETCDGIDNNCGFGIDEPDAQGCTVYYEDIDGDSYGNPSSSQCICAASGNFDTTNNGDCYDLNGDARPNQTSYFTTHRGDGSFDYNCSGSNNLQYTSTTTYSCSQTSLGIDCNYTNGWLGGGRPGCGQTRDYGTGCFWIPLISCNENTLTTRTQGCR